MSNEVDEDWPKTFFTVLTVTLVVGFLITLGYVNVLRS